MNLYILLYIVGTFAISMVCGFVSIPVIIRFCKRNGLYDRPDSRKVHNSSVPRLGGVCFIPSMALAAIIMVMVFNKTMDGAKIMMGVWSVVFFISLMLIYAVGLIDDLVSLSPKVKFAVQIVAAALLPMAGLYINNMYGFLGVQELPFCIGAPLTVFLMVFINNAMNLIDGIDGLSGGLSIIALAGFLVCFAREGVWTYCILIAGMMGVLVAFLYFNIIGGKDGKLKIFMGDSGSLTLGFILGFLLVKFSMDNPTSMPFRRESLMLSFTLLAIPLLDVCRVVCVRTLHRKPIFGADKNHIHHKLMRAGLTQRQALLAILGLAVVYIVINVSLFDALYFSYIVVVDVAVWFVFHAVVNRKIRKRGNPVFFIDHSK